ncbi:meiotic sister-chromatid recombination aldehyde dehydrogenase [Wolfiporia cocos MD-104 SS10]|uniref:Meiotic sister-chromatid recombination aldehyde dehydrogenase n=1 Tax=Wolfiporia cocos (strain MD-104) TaxID=742152 RepID=A0A2H3J971_WOLCO|nr:meiotic sister-chromatid recombination aldehyde dehydrogenase [Wolfiporia cocos MD-104 SS10]
MADDDGLDVFYPLTLFFALGIWLVFHRFQTVHNRAVPFRHPPPPQIGPHFEPRQIPHPSLDAHLLHEELRPHFMDPDRRYITAYDPATSFHLGTFLADSALEIGMKVRAAQDAQRAWRHTAFRDRRRVIRSLNKWLVDNQEACARVACRDSGKTLVDAAFGEVMATCSKLTWLIKHGERYLRPEPRSTNFLLFYKKGYVVYEPLGVVAAITSWNYPLHNAWSPIVASLFAGNAVVLKCSEQVVWSTTWFVNAIKECLRACGHSPELVQLVCCYPEDADALTKSPAIKHITFIGSEHVGRQIAMAATENLTPVTLELGGKDAAIIMPHTNLRQYLSLWLRAIFQNAGQNCIGLERLIVHASQHDELFALLSGRAQQLRLGSALASPQDGFVPAVDVGAMISPARVAATDALVQLAHDADLPIEGGEPHAHPYLEHGAYFRPTVIGDVDPESEIAQRELFAPVVVLIKYDTIAEAVEIANGTRYGLGASVFGPDQEKCVQVARQLECGMVSINDFGVCYVSQDLPFGGTKKSGYGRFGGPEGLRSLTNPKAIMVDRFAWLMQTTIPPQLDYPIQSVTTSWQFLSGLTGFTYGDSWRTRIEGLVQLVKASRR